MKERFTNGFKFIQNDQLEQRLFKKIDDQNHETQIASNDANSMESKLFKFFDGHIDKSLIDQQKDAYINLVKNMFQHAQSGQNEQPQDKGQRDSFQVDCILLKAFYQVKGTLILTSDELMFIYLDYTKQIESNYVQALDVRNHDSLFFFTKD